MNSKRKKILLIVVLCCIILAIRLSGFGSYFSFENLKGHSDLLLKIAAAHPLLSPLLFILLYVLVAGLSIPGATILTLAAGFVFGTIPATLYVNIGATIGSALAFLTIRYVAGDWFHAKYSGQLEKFNAELAKNGTYYLLTIRLIPIFPFFLINILGGFTRIPLRTFVSTRSVGIIPGHLVYSFAGSQLGSIQSPSDIFSRNILIAVALLAAFSLIPAVYNHIKSANPKRPRGE